MENEAQLALLDRLVKETTGIVEALGAEPGRVIEFGFVATLTLADLCRVPIAGARSRRTGLLRPMTDGGPQAARDRALQTAHSRYRLDKFFGGIAWHCIAHAVASLLIVRHLHQAYADPDRLQSAIAASNTISDEIDRLIGSYVDASPAERNAADVGSVATLIDKSAREAAIDQSNSLRMQDAAALAGGG